GSGSAWSRRPSSTGWSEMRWPGSSATKRERTQASPRNWMSPVLGRGAAEDAGLWREAHARVGRRPGIVGDVGRRRPGGDGGRRIAAGEIAGRGRALDRARRPRGPDEPELGDVERRLLPLAGGPDDDDPGFLLAEDRSACRRGPDEAKGGTDGRCTPGCLHGRGPFRRGGTRRQVEEGNGCSALAGVGRR